MVSAFTDIQNDTRHKNQLGFTIFMNSNYNVNPGGQSRIGELIAIIRNYKMFLPKYEP